MNDLQKGRRGRSAERPGVDQDAPPRGGAPHTPLSPDGRRALAEIFHLYQAWLRRRLARLYGRDVAEDLTQEAFARFARYSEAAAKVHFPKALLLRIAVNAARSAARRSCVGAAAVSRVDPLGSGEGTGGEAEQDEALALKQIILSMPQAWRDVFILNRFLGLTYGQIAERLGLSVKTVEWRMSKALAHCARALDRSA